MSSRLAQKSITNRSYLFIFPMYNTDHFEPTSSDTFWLTIPPEKGKQKRAVIPQGLA